jgi:hypothetical protein
MNANFPKVIFRFSGVHIRIIDYRIKIIVTFFLKINNPK